VTTVPKLVIKVIKTMISFERFSLLVRMECWHRPFALLHYNDKVQDLNIVEVFHFLRLSQLKHYVVEIVLDPMELFYEGLLGRYMFNLMWVGLWHEEWGPCKSIKSTQVDERFKIL